MKDSGVEWIGEIPINVKIIKLKSISNIINGYAFKSEMFTDDENELNVITISSFDNQKILPEKLSYSVEKKDFSKYLLQENDILIAMSGGTVGKNVLVRNIRKNMYINQRVCILRSQYYKYISYWINSDSFKEYTLLNSIGSAQPNISSTQLNEFDIPWSNEVEKVVDILDEKISIIEDIIVKTKNSIEELKKYKQSLITEVVTKGLDKNVEMKDSGIEWIGEIPKDWSIVKINKVAKIKNGKEVSTETGVIPVYGSGGIFKYTDDFLYEGESVLFGRKGTIGKPIYTNSKIWTVDTMFYTEIKNTIIAKLFYYFLTAFPWSIYETKTALPSIVGGEIEQSKILLPNKKTQQEIVNYLDEKTEAIDNIVESKYILIREYESYKKSLIYEYVTGKKEVGEEVE